MVTPFGQRARVLAFADEWARTFIVLAIFFLAKPTPPPPLKPLKLHPTIAQMALILCADDAT